MLGAAAVTLIQADDVEPALPGFRCHAAHVVDIARPFEPVQQQEGRFRGSIRVPVTPRHDARIGGHIEDSIDRRGKIREMAWPRPRVNRHAMAADPARMGNELEGHFQINSSTMKKRLTFALCATIFCSTVAFAQSNARLDALKNEAAAKVDGRAKLAQEMVDSVFSFGELGFQEIETSRYLTGILEKNGFKVERGISNMPTAWVARWGSGKPVIALGSDIDGIPQASQKPGVAYKDPIIPGAPGHGEGHNSGVPLNITAALAVKKIMERDKLPGTLMLWPGVAEELVASKAWFVRDGMFKDVDVVLFTHVGNNLTVSWGGGSGNGLVSLEYTFQGESAHSAGNPQRGRSALDAVELMNHAWNMKREHLRIQQRSHYVITNGGDQPNVVPPTASVWYYLRETDYKHIKEMWDVGNTMAKAAAMMTNTDFSTRVLGSAWPGHFN